MSSNSIVVSAIEELHQLAHRGIQTIYGACFNLQQLNRGLAAFYAGVDHYRDALREAAKGDGAAELLQLLVFGSNEFLNFATEANRVAHEKHMQFVRELAAGGVASGDRRGEARAAEGKRGEAYTPPAFDRVRSSNIYPDLTKLLGDSRHRTEYTLKGYISSHLYEAAWYLRSQQILFASGAKIATPTQTYLDYYLGVVHVAKEVFATPLDVIYGVICRYLAEGDAAAIQAQIRARGAAMLDANYCCALRARLLSEYDFLFGAPVDLRDCDLRARGGRGCVIGAEIAQLKAFHAIGTNMIRRVFGAR